MNLQVSVISNLHNFGITEDGQQFIAERFMVMIETTSGKRWVHEHHFDGTKPVFEEEIGAMVFPDLREEAQAEAAKLVGRIEMHLSKGGEIDLAKWREEDPCYGSDAYIELDYLGHFKNREKMEDSVIFH